MYIIMYIIPLNSNHSTVTICLLTEHLTLVAYFNLHHCPGCGTITFLRRYVFTTAWQFSRVILLSGLSLPGSVYLKLSELLGMWILSGKY